MASIYRKKYFEINPATGERVQRQSRKWWGRYYDEDGRLKRKSLATDKRVAQAMLLDIVRKIERKKSGIDDSVDEEMQRNINVHLDDFEAYLKGKGVTERHRSETMMQVRRIVDTASWQTPTDIRSSDVTRFLNALRDQGRSAQTNNHYLKSVKHFTKWLHTENRISRDPLLNLKRLNVQTDRRHDRRALSPEEMILLIETAETGPPVEGLSGPDRAMLYMLAAWTGLRKGEIGSLTPKSFSFHNKIPIVRSEATNREDCASAATHTVTVEAGFSKHRRRDIQPLHPDLVVKLMEWIERRGFATDEILFPISERTCGVERKTYVMIRKDLAAARKLWLAGASDKNERKHREESDFLLYKNHQGLYADFHATRHTFITNLARGGVSPKVAQSLAHHSDIRLTMQTYTHFDHKEQAEAINMLPRIG